MKIIIDTREQTPWSFSPDVEVEVGTIQSGDYALAGDETHFAIERKSGDDFVGTISSGWDRFQRELDRMDAAAFPAKIIIVEVDFAYFCYRTVKGEVLAPQHQHVKCTPQFVMKRIAELSFRNVSVLFAGDPGLASAIAQSIFVEREKRLTEGLISCV